MATVDDKLMQRQAEVQDIIDATDVWNIDSKLERAMGALRCPPGDWPVTNLSGGERRRVALCRLLLQKPDVLLLDEPTNDIDVNTLRALEEGLEAFAGCAVVISHDRWFLDRICTHILAFEGNGEVFFFEGSYSEYEINKARRLGDTEIKKGRYRKLMEE